LAGPLLVLGALARDVRLRVVFGSIGAFTADAWLLQPVPTSRVSTCAYVDPTIAALLGWAVLGESVRPVTLLARP
jgi:drug/metabolite transporter (DMT)-like permease